MAVTMFSNPSEYLLSWNIIFIKIFADAINESNPRVIDDSRARKLANDLKRCAYYETCATYGLNVERVFQDGKLCRMRELLSCLLNWNIFSLSEDLYRARRVQQTDHPEPLCAAALPRVRGQPHQHQRLHQHRHGDSRASTLPGLLWLPPGSISGTSPSSSEHVREGE